MDSKTREQLLTELTDIIELLKKEEDVTAYVKLKKVHKKLLLEIIEDL